MTLGGRRWPSLRVALVFWGVPIALIAPGPYFAAALLLLAIIGAANSVEDVAVFTLLQRIVPTTSSPVCSGSSGASRWVASRSARSSRRRSSTRLGRVRRSSSSADPAAPDARGLPPARRDRQRRPSRRRSWSSSSACRCSHRSRSPRRSAWRHLVPVSVSAGDVVIRAGDGGDRFYIVGAESSRSTPPAAARPPAEGDYFGEIALLRDVPRTATVTAASTRAVRAAARRLPEAVTGHSAAHAVGQEVAEARLARAGSIESG